MAAFQPPEDKTNPVDLVIGANSRAADLANFLRGGNPTALKV
jgi:hypothetical protein